MAQLKKYGTFNAVQQYLAERSENEKLNINKDDITGRFIRRGAKRKRGRK